MEYRSGPGIRDRVSCCKSDGAERSGRFAVLDVVDIG